MKKNKLIYFLLSIFILLNLIFVNSCKPAMGTSWYPKTMSDEKPKFYVTEISIKNNSASPILSQNPADEADKLKKFAEAEVYVVNVPYSVDEITYEDITVKAVTSLTGMEKLEVSVEINGDGVPLSSGKDVPVTIKIKDNASAYGILTKIIKVKRGEPAELTLKKLKVCGLDAMSKNVTVPYRENIISSAKIEAWFNDGYGDDRLIPVEVENNIIELKENETRDIKIFVKENKGQYKYFEDFVSVTRGEKQGDEDEVLVPKEIYVMGIKNEIGKTVNVPINTEQITAADIIVVFNKYGYIPVKLAEDPIMFDASDTAVVNISVEPKEGEYQEWSTSLTIKKDSMSVYNPVDKNGNKKYVIKIKTINEEIDPFTYYDENYEFPASKFDDWVLNIPTMSGIIASYKFMDGEWTGSPEKWNNQPGDIGSGLKAISNVKVYRYKNRTDRWNGSYIPAHDPNDSRFYFYRFTADASGGITADNSMFCVDKNSKFIFYYSDPAYLQVIFGNKVPYNWTDYAAPSSGDHLQFPKPFYMSDPVGYVKEDGTVVMYSWVKDNINNSDYHAKENPAFTKPAEKKSNGAGFSPYRNKIKQTRVEVITEENPDYTVAYPAIVGQPKALRIKIGTEGELKVKAAPVPQGENLSYQWYTKDGNVTAEIEGAIDASYKPDTGIETNTSVYCKVTNTNSANGSSESIDSDTVKLLITNGAITIDAEEPEIIEQPSGKIIPINTSGTVLIGVKAVSVDKGSLSYQWYENSQPDTETGIIMDGKTEALLELNIDTSSTKILYYYCLVTNTNNNVDGNKTAKRKSAAAKVEVEEAYKIIFDKEGKGTITALCDGKLLETGSYVKKGKPVTFFAQAADGYEVLNWSGVPLSAISENKMSASLNVEKEEIVKVVFRKIPDNRKLTITARRLENIDMGGWDFILKAWGDKVDHAYFVYDFRARIFDPHTNIPDFTSIWSRLDGRDLTGIEQVNLAELLYKKGKGPNISTSGEMIIKDFDSLPAQQTFQLDTKLVKYDRAAFGAWTYQQYLSNYNQSVIEFTYNEKKDEWSWKKADIPNNFNFRPNFTNDNYQFEVTLPPENFVLKRGETKDFTIRYWIELEKPTYAKGTVEVTYTLKWE